MWMLVRRALVPLSSFPKVIIVNSYSGLRFHEGLGYRARSWLYVPNSLDLDAFRPDPEARVWLRSELGLTPGARLVGLIARFHPVKDHRTFIEAAKLLAAKSNDIHFVLVGGGVDYTNVQLIQLIESSGFAERFHPLGHRTDINRITAALDVACSSSTSQGTSNVICEAMACGIPCVVTDVGDSSLIVRDVGQVVPAKRPSAFARACCDLLFMSPDQRRKIGLAARQRIEECFSLRFVVDRYQELYEQLASDSSGFARRSESGGGTPSYSTR